MGRREGESGKAQKEHAHEAEEMQAQHARQAAQLQPSHGVTLAVTHAAPILVAIRQHFFLKREKCNQKYREVPEETILQCARALHVSEVGKGLEKRRGH